MEDTNVWEVDRIAAAELLALLKETSEADWGPIIAKAFSRSRLQSYQWAANRVHESAMKVLEEGAFEEFQHRDAIWTDGYRNAEQQLSAHTPADLLGTVARPPRTRGQVLRSLLRSAKQQAFSNAKSS